MARVPRANAGWLPEHTEGGQSRAQDDTSGYATFCVKRKAEETTGPLQEVRGNEMEKLGSGEQQRRTNRNISANDSRCRDRSMTTCPHSGKSQPKSPLKPRDLRVQRTCEETASSEGVPGQNQSPESPRAWGGGG